jgi:putative component of membrane protein insertase Oxa1/YidC/SpoIIIJ protein YidD
LIINRKYLTLFFFLLQLTTLSQTDWIRWEKSDPTYKLPDPFAENVSDFKMESSIDIVLKPLLNTYWFFISDVDGDNCPFYPTCSRFFLQSVKQTNLGQGILMISDRFVRDTNFINKQEHYPYYNDRHFYDPVTSYTLNSKKIKFIPPNTHFKE